MKAETKTQLEAERQRLALLEKQRIASVIKSRRRALANGAKAVPIFGTKDENVTRGDKGKVHLHNASYCHGERLGLFVDALKDIA